MECLKFDMSQGISLTLTIFDCNVGTWTVLGIETYLGKAKLQIWLRAGCRVIQCLQTWI